MHRGVLIRIGALIGENTVVRCWSDDYGFGGFGPPGLGHFPGLSLAHEYGPGPEWARLCLGRARLLQLPVFGNI